MRQKIIYKKAITFLFTGIVIAFLHACEYKKWAEPSQPKPLPAVVSFSQDIIPIFNTACNTSGCHSGTSPAGNLNLSANVAYRQLFFHHDVDTINPNSSILYIQIASGTMPPSGKLSDYDIGLVQKWIQQKAKNN